MENIWEVGVCKSERNAFEEIRGKRDDVEYLAENMYDLKIANTRMKASPSTVERKEEKVFNQFCVRTRSQTKLKLQVNSDRVLRDTE